MAIKVLITDDHKVVRHGLRGFLELDPELEVVGEASNGREAVDTARALLPDVVLMDLLMPVMDGIAATREIRRGLPEVEVVALTSVLEDASVTGAIRAGAIGYLLKTRHEIPVHAILGEEPDLSLETKEALYRIAQEALHNTAKHARATRADLKLGCDATDIALEVSDDGAGFDPEGDFSGHLGLKSMRERAARLGGEIQIQSAPGEGTSIRVRVP